MNKFDKYFTYFLIVIIIFSVGMFGYAIVTEGLNYNPEIPNSSELFSLLFSFVGYMFGIMITLGIMLSWLAVFDDEKKPEDMSDEEWSEKMSNRIGGAVTVSLFWPAIIVFSIFYFIFSYFKERK